MACKTKDHLGSRDDAILKIFVNTPHPLKIRNTNVTLHYVGVSPMSIAEVNCPSLQK